MNLAVLSESAADEAAIRILINGILGQETIPVNIPPLRSRGWPSVLRVIRPVMGHLHYQTDADAFVVVVDSNTSPVHQSSHVESDEASEGCRLCQLESALGDVQSRLRPLPGRRAIKTAVGLAVPAIEAWYRCERDARVTEATWMEGLRSGAFPYSKNRLKEDIYGTDRPSLEHETARAVEEAQRLVGDLGLLEIFFPNGFGALAQKVRTWH